jgi:hypothetical protein
MVPPTPRAAGRGVIPVPGKTGQAEPTMETEKLLAWLRLPSGPWPPEDRVLLGLPPGPVDAALAETNALERMEWLRPHQLLAPDAVTEGMNRLAQALVNLQSEAPAPPPVTPLVPKKRKKKIAAVVPEVEPEILDAEVVQVEEPGVLHAPQRWRTKPIADEIPALPAPPPPGTAFIPADRRAAYRELVRLRRCARVWDQFRTTVGDPSEQLLTPGRVLEYLLAIHALSKERFECGWPTQAGQTLLVVARQPVPLALFRDLVPSQRQRLAAEWAATRDELQFLQSKLRQTLRQGRRRTPWQAQWRAGKTWLRENPEWLPVLLFLLAFAVALARAATRKNLGA